MGERKPIKIPQINIMRMWIRPKMAAALKVKKIFAFTFFADKSKDHLTVSGWGLIEGKIAPENVVCEPMKLSEHPDIEEVAMKIIKKYIDTSIISEVKIMEGTIDFAAGTIKGEVGFVATDKRQVLREFTSTF